MVGVALGEVRARASTRTRASYRARARARGRGSSLVNGHGRHTTHFLNVKAEEGLDRLGLGLGLESRSGSDQGQIRVRVCLGSDSGLGFKTDSEHYWTQRSSCRKGSGQG